SILKNLNTVWWPNGSPDAAADDKKRMDYMNSFENISVFLNKRAYAANAESDTIKSVDARHTSTGESIRFVAPLFIDCTGDGWIGYWAGAEYMYGREDSSEYKENWSQNGELWSPAAEDNRVMGSSVLWRTADKGSPVKFPEVPWAMDVAGDYSATMGTWKWEYSDNDKNQITNGEEIRDHMLKAIYGSFYNAKQDPLNVNLSLEWTSFLLGKRESRRLVGDYIYTFQDEKNMTEFPDAVAMEERDVDVHYQQKLKDPSQPDFLSEALYYKVDHYYIPFRSLYSKNIGNLLMAGRCFSCSHVGLGGPRVMNTTGQMGVAVGYAASLCNKYSTGPRGVYENHMAELQNLIGIK
ncbi:MAG: FAD-dependent oxidoreductase, partial [Chloroflexota bacterium]